MVTPSVLVAIECRTGTLPHDGLPIAILLVYNEPLESLHDYLAQRELHLLVELKG